MRVATNGNPKDAQQAFDLEDAQKRLKLIAAALEEEQEALAEVKACAAALRAAKRRAIEARWKVATVTHRLNGGAS